MCEAVRLICRVAMLSCKYDKCLFCFSYCVMQLAASVV